MAKINYAAWSVDSKQFSERWSDARKLQFFAQYAILAPSGHNTQPWRFSFDRDTLLLKADYNRRLPYSGVQANEPYVSLGACLSVLQLAARGFGYELSIDYVLRDDVIASVKITSKTAADPGLLEAITQRVSNRNNYETKNLPEALLKKITKSQFKGVSAQIISSASDIKYIADLTTQATLTTFSDKEFRSELSKWVRNNVTRQHDGMPGFVQGIPTPPSLLARHIVKRLDVSKDQAKKDSSRVLNSGNLIIVTIQNPNEAGLMDGGRVYAQICVLAQQQNIATTGIGAAIIDPKTTTAMIKRFSLPGKPIAIIRLGRTSKKAKHTPRWPVAKLTD